MSLNKQYALRTVCPPNPSACSKLKGPFCLKVCKPRLSPHHGAHVVEVIEAQPGFRHRIEVWGDQLRVAVVGSVTPALIVGHDENDVRPVRREQWDGQEERKRDDGYQVFHGFAWVVLAHFCGGPKLELQPT